jgi:hypothetical protein
VLSASFETEGDAMPTQGTLTLRIGEASVGESGIKTHLGKFSLAGEGLNIGKERAEPVTDGYPGDCPWAFPGTVATRPSSTSSATADTCR